MVISGIADEAGKTVEEQIAAHKELGWNHIEMRTVGSGNFSGWGGVSAENCLKLIEEIDSPAFRILFDIGNPVVEGQDSCDFYNRVKQYIVYIHIKDAKREDNSHVYTFPGDGDGYVQEIVADLKSSGYEGVLSIEPHLSAIIHEGKGVDDSFNASRVYVEYGKKLEEIVKSLTV